MRVSVLEMDCGRHVLMVTHIWDQDDYSRANSLELACVCSFRMAGRLSDEWYTCDHVGKVLSGFGQVVSCHSQVVSCDAQVS